MTDRSTLSPGLRDALGPADSSRVIAAMAEARRNSRSSAYPDGVAGAALAAGLRVARGLLPCRRIGARQVGRGRFRLTLLAVPSALVPWTQPGNGYCHTRQVLRGLIQNLRRIKADPRLVCIYEVHAAEFRALFRCRMPETQGISP